MHHRAWRCWSGSLSKGGFDDKLYFIGEYHIMRLIVLTGLIFISTLLLPVEGRADIIHLKNGNKVEGIVTEERANSVTIKLDIGTLTFSRSEIASIESSSNEEKEALEKSWDAKKKNAPPAKMRVKPALDTAAKSVPSKINWLSSYNRGMSRAKNTGKSVMIDFYTDWCGWCKKLDSDTYKDKEVLSLAGNLVCIKIDADKNKSIAQQYNVRGYPTILFLNSSGEELGRISGYLPARPFAQKMKSFLK